MTNEQVSRTVEKAVGKLKDQQLKKAKTEEIINFLVDCFERQTGRKVKNKPLFLELEKVK